LAVPDEDTPRGRSANLVIVAGCFLAAVVVGILVLRG
jgi:hypothetical protein